MEPTDPPPDDDGPAVVDPPTRPWGPGSPAPGTPVAAFDVRRDDEAKLEASEATALYEAARFPDLEEVTRAPADSSGRRSGSGPGDGVGHEGENGDRAGLRILGVPAPREIAGPVLAALALAALVYGWRRRRRRR
ncbi:MAG TPA: hypothetical protein VM142_14370 [Acidimicrobiales bacterium]|nr:hypothetical protein [Acidimicrobiales bacterium]